MCVGGVQHDSGSCRITFKNYWPAARRVKAADVVRWPANWRPVGELAELSVIASVAPPEAIDHLLVGDIAEKLPEVAAQVLLRDEEQTHRLPLISEGSIITRRRLRGSDFEFENGRLKSWLVDGTSASGTK
jgi:hypothetical protein